MPARTQQQVFAEFPDFHVAVILRECGFELLDSQATTSHLKRFGCIDIPASEYRRRLDLAMRKECKFV